MRTLSAASSSGLQPDYGPPTRFILSQSSCVRPRSTVSLESPTLPPANRSIRIVAAPPPRTIHYPPPTTRRPPSTHPPAHHLLCVLVQLQDAVCDLFVCAAARVFAGSFGSSFSDAIVHLRTVCRTTHADDQHVLMRKKLSGGVPMPQA